MVSFWDLAYIVGAPWDRGQPPRELTQLIEESRLEACRVLDIGCGTGTSVVYLASRGFEASGLDISSMAIRKAKRNASSQGVNCRFYRLDFTDREAVISAGLSTFDLLIDIGCYHSLSPEDRDRYAASLLHVSRVGTTYLLWAFLQGSGQGFGPPGVDRHEVEDQFSKNFKVRTKRELEDSYRSMLFYLMEQTK
jgi:cyclopropane fatty-acyl-phospholipid synthase-like methyltransferase